MDSPAYWVDLLTLLRVRCSMTFVNVEYERTRREYRPGVKSEVENGSAGRGAKPDENGMTHRNLAANRVRPKACCPAFRCS